MGTNYYLQEEPPCEACGHAGEPIHIGKSSAGWCFLLRVYPEHGILDLPDWVKKWSQPGVYIINEYGDRVTQEAMYDCITNRSSNIPLAPGFHKQNHSEDGPNGLIRCRLMPGRCIGHGAGTWDLLAHEFE